VADALHKPKVIIFYANVPYGHVKWFYLGLPGL